MLLDLKLEEKLSFIQISTISEKSNLVTPKLRTVLFRYENELDCFQFDTSTHTHKWQQLSALPKLSAVYLNTDNFTQYRFEASAELISIDNHKHTELFTAHWLRTRPDLRKTLWEEHLKTQTIEAEFNIEQPCPLFGTVLVRPYCWDIFTLDRQDFSHSKRCQMVLENNHWKVFEDTSNIHPLDLLEN